MGSGRVRSVPIALHNDSEYGVLMGAAAIAIGPVPNGQDDFVPEFFLLSNDGLRPGLRYALNKHYEKTGEGVPLRCLFNVYPQDNQAHAPSSKALLKTLVSFCADENISLNHTYEWNPAFARLFVAPFGAIPAHSNPILQGRTDDPFEFLRVTVPLFSAGSPVSYPDYTATARLTAVERKVMSQARTAAVNGPILAHERAQDSRLPDNWADVLAFLNATKQRERWTLRDLCNRLEVPHSLHFYGILQGKYIPAMRPGAATTDFVKRALLFHKEEAQKNSPANSERARPRMPLAVAFETLSINSTLSSPRLVDVWIDEHADEIARINEIIDRTDILISGQVAKRNDEPALSSVTIHVSSRVADRAEDLSAVFPQDAHPPVSFDFADFQDETRGMGASISTTENFGWWICNDLEEREKRNGWSVPC